MWPRRRQWSIVGSIAIRGMRGTRNTRGEGPVGHLTQLASLLTFREPGIELVSAGKQRREISCSSDWARPRGRQQGPRLPDPTAETAVRTRRSCALPADGTEISASELMDGLYLLSPSNLLAPATLCMDMPTFGDRDDVEESAATKAHIWYGSVADRADGLRAGRGPDLPVVTRRRGSSGASGRSGSRSAPRSPTGTRPWTSDHRRRAPLLLRRLRDARRAGRPRQPRHLPARAGAAAAHVDREIAGAASRRARSSSAWARTTSSPRRRASKRALAVTRPMYAAAGAD